MSGNFVQAGIKEIYIAPDGATPFPVGLAGVTGLGFRNAGNLIVEPLNPMQAGLQKIQFENLTTFRFEGETVQVDDTVLFTTLIGAVKSGFLATAIIGSGATNNGTVITNANGGVFLFSGVAGGMGVDFELNVGLSTRNLKLTLERAYKAVDGRAKLTAAKTATFPFVAEKTPMIDDTKVLDGFITPDFIPATLTGLFADVNLVDFNVKLSTDGQKNGFAMTRVRGLNVELTAEADGADIDDMVALLDWELKNTDITIDLGTVNLVFKAKGLSRLGTANVGDDNRRGKFTFMGRYDSDYAVVAGNVVTLNTFMQSGA